MSNERELEQETLRIVKERICPDTSSNCSDCQNRNVSHHTGGTGGPDGMIGFVYGPCKKKLTWRENCPGFEKKKEP
jgi:hypothetical protein